MTTPKTTGEKMRKLEGLIVLRSQKIEGRRKMIFEFDREIQELDRFIEMEKMKYMEIPK